tara:strand:+ start:4878 stop:6524 length:1647 start_codon:yes stop_codon:yes gene_type:complete
MTDIIFLSIPKLEVKGPILAITQLTACAKEAGFSAKAIDFNEWLYNQTKDTSLSHIWDIMDRTLLSDDIKDIEDIYILYFHKFYDEVIKKINPKIIGISVFSTWTYPNLLIVTREIRNINPKVKIIIGGPVIASNAKQALFYTHGITPPKKSFFDDLKESNLIDDYISGDAEISVVEYLKGNYDYPGINSYDHKPIENQDNIPTPDYEDIDYEKYPSPALFIKGSRGCVRKCAFCNVPTLWQKFKWKSADKIFEEITYLHNKYPYVKQIKFTDSLTNGNYKEFLKLMELVSDWKEKNRSSLKVFKSYLSSKHNKNYQDCFGFSIHGQFICREKNQIKPNMFELMKGAGYLEPTCGIESGSEKVRKELGKYFSNEAIEYHLDEMNKNKLRMIPLMFVGFPTETDKDFQESIDILDMFARYPNVIGMVGMDHPMVVISGTPVFMNPERYYVDTESLGEMVPSHPSSDLRWKGKYSDYKKRIERFFIFAHEAQQRKIYDKPTVSGNSFTFIKDYMEFKNKDSHVLNIIEKWMEGQEHFYNKSWDENRNYKI